MTHTEYNAKAKDMNIKVAYHTSVFEITIFIFAMLELITYKS
jgi:hypothetical protein